MRKMRMRDENTYNHGLRYIDTTAAITFSIKHAKRKSKPIQQKNGKENRPEILKIFKTSENRIAIWEKSQTNITILYILSLNCL